MTCIQSSTFASVQYEHESINEHNTSIEHDNNTSKQCTYMYVNKLKDEDYLMHSVTI